MTAWHVYVEGNSDKRFLECIASHMCIEGVDFQSIGGGVSKLRAMEQEMKRRGDEGKRLGVVVDANSDCQERRSELTEVIAEMGISVEKTFLLPDNARPGCLETLLQDIAVERHHEIYRCFENYEACLRRDHYRLPDGKARVYAYCSALGIETHQNRRHYCDARYWNLDHAPALQPLKEFLQSLAP